MEASNIKFNVILKNPKYCIIALAVLFLFSYTFATAVVIKNKYQIERLTDTLSSLEQSNGQLRVELSQASSLEYVLEASKNLSYSEITGIRYIEKPSESPFAVK